VSHLVGAHTASLQPNDSDSSDNDDGGDDGNHASTSASASSTPAASPTPAATTPASAADCEAFLVAPRETYALVPCGHARFCASCADRVAALDAGCPVCRASITMVMRVFA